MNTTLNKPSKLRERQREIASQIELLEHKREKFRNQHQKLSKEYAQSGAPCPECGSSVEPKMSGFGRAVSATCPDCGFVGRDAS